MGYPLGILVAVNLEDEACAAGKDLVLVAQILTCRMVGSGVPKEDLRNRANSKTLFTVTLKPPLPASYNEFVHSLPPILYQFSNIKRNIINIANIISYSFV